MEYCVYRHTSPSGKVYIGITCQSPERRWRHDGSGYRENKRLMNAIKKYGWQNFKHEVLFQGLSKDEACQKEIELIAAHKSHEFRYGYNQSLGGEHGELAEESKQAIREKIAELWKSDEYREHMSRAHIGQRTSLGKKMSDESRTKVSDAVRERCKDPEYRARLSSSAKKRTTQERMRAIGKIAWENEDSRNKIIASRVGNHYRAKRVLCVETGVVYPSTKDAAKHLGVARETIGQVCRGKRETTHGYHWRFADE